MDNINVYLKTSESNFWYEHGVELGAAIVTLVAFLFTFWNINRTNKRQELEEQKKNEKTLKMIDLVTQTERAEISKFIHNFDISLQTQPDKNKLYFIEFPLINYETTSKMAVIVNNSARYLEKNSIYMKLENYKSNIKELLLKQHTNLNLNTLEKVTNKMEYIDDALKVIDDLKTHQFISNEIIRENEKSLCKELEKYKELNKIIEELSSKLNG